MKTTFKLPSFCLIVLMLFFTISFMGCSGDEDSNCDTFDIETPRLFVRLIDEDGNNLLENGTIDPEEITVLNDEELRVVGEIGFTQYDNTLELLFPEEANFEYVIQLSELEMIRLVFSAELTNSICDISFFNPTSVTLNDQNLALLRFFEVDYLVEVVL